MKKLNVCVYCSARCRVVSVYVIYLMIGPEYVFGLFALCLMSSSRSHLFIYLSTEEESDRIEKLDRFRRCLIESFYSV